jgi:hypothetical protein
MQYTRHRIFKADQNRLPILFGARKITLTGGNKYHPETLALRPHSSRFEKYIYEPIIKK